MLYTAIITELGIFNITISAGKDLGIFMKYFVKRLISLCMVLVVFSCIFAPSVQASENENEIYHSSFLQAGQKFISTYSGYPSYAEIMSMADKYDSVKLYTLPREEWGYYFAYQIFTLKDQIDLKGCNMTVSQVDELARYAKAIAPWYPLFHHTEKIMDAAGSVAIARVVYNTDRTSEMKAQEKRVLSLVDGVESDAVKALVIHDFLCKDIEYYLDANRNIFAPVLDKKAQCEGYARVYSYYMNLVGVPCEYIEGNTTEGYHAWNRIYIDGQWYLVDATWDDIGNSAVKHQYFLSSGANFTGHSVSSADRERCNDTKYESAFWKQKNAVYTACGDNIIYPDITYDDVYIIRSHSFANDSISEGGKQIASWGMQWRNSSNQPVSANYSTPVSYHGKIYYNTSTAVWCCDADGSNSKKIIDKNNPVSGQPNISKSEYFFNLEMRDGTLFVTTAPNTDKWLEKSNCKTYTYTVDSSNEYVKPVHTISTNKDSLLVAVGGKVKFEYEPVKFTAAVSSDTSICDIEDGYVVGKSAGKATIVLTTEETLEYKADRREIPVEVTQNQVIDISQGYIMINNRDWKWPLAYTGSEVRPVVEVGYFDDEDGDTVIDPEHYDVKYENNINEGTATVTATAKGEGYIGSVSTTFPITKQDIDYDNFRANSATVTLGAGVILNIGIDNAIKDQFEQLYFTVEFGKEKYNLTKINADKSTAVRSYYDFDKISPEKFGDDVVFYPVGVTADGVEHKGQPITYSIKQYCMSTLNKNLSNTLNKLIVEILYYGEAYQTYRNYKTNNLVTKDLTPEQRALHTTDVPEYTKLTNPAYEKNPNGEDANEVSFKAATLLLEGKVIPKIKFEIPATSNISDYVFLWTINNKLHYFTYDEHPEWFSIISSTPTTIRYQVSCEILNANQFSIPFYLTVFKNDKQVSNKLAYSVESYATGNVVKNDPRLKALVDQILRYGRADTAFVGSTQ